MDHNTQEDSQFKQGYLYAVRLLTASKKSATQLLKRFKEKGYKPEIAESVLEKLKEQGILNDRKMVDETIQWAKQAKRYGKRRIAMELKKKGIAQNVIDDSLSHYSKEEERETALVLAQVRWQKLERIEPNKRKKRMYDFLISRGFDFETTREIVDQLNSKQNHENF